MIPFAVKASKLKLGGVVYCCLKIDYQPKVVVFVSPLISFGTRITERASSIFNRFWGRDWIKFSYLFIVLNSGLLVLLGSMSGSILVKHGELFMENLQLIMMLT